MLFSVVCKSTSNSRVTNNTTLPNPFLASSSFSFLLFIVVSITYRTMKNPMQKKTNDKIQIRVYSAFDAKGTI